LKTIVPSEKVLGENQKRIGFRGDGTKTEQNLIILMAID